MLKKNETFYIKQKNEKSSINQNCLNAKFIRIVKKKLVILGKRYPLIFQQ